MRNANSPNFPFVISHSFSSKNTDCQINRKKSNQMQGSLLNSYTNESMDMFRLSSNREANRTITNTTITSKALTEVMN